MVKGLRHEDPRCGREHFDARAGIDWELGPDPNDTAYSRPDTPWNQKPGSKFICGKGRWAVTDFGLELLSDFPERNDIYKISGYELLNEWVATDGSGRFYKWPLMLAMEPWIDIDVFEAFEHCFYLAMPIHCRMPLPIPRTLDEAIKMHFSKRTLQDQPCRTDPDVLKRTFREPHAIVRERDSTEK
jgi:hypothetical protein